MYCYYKEKVAGIDGLRQADVDYSTYCSVIREFNSKLVNGLICETLEFKIPFRMGKFRIKKFKQKIKLDSNGDVDKKNLPVDWEKTKEMWRKIYPELTKSEIEAIPKKKVIYHLNEHTAGYRCILFWDRINCNVINNRVYSATFTFTNRRKLAYMLKTDCKINYYE